MTALSPNDIHELREALGWSAREMGAFFNRTGVTIYHWESGKTSPGTNMRALLSVLHQELSRQDQQCSEQELQQWTDRLLDRGIEALLHGNTRAFSIEEAAPSCEQMVERACRHGGLTIRSSSGETLAYLVPNSTPELLRWAHTLLEITVREEHFSEMNSPATDTLPEPTVSIDLEER